MFFYNRRIIDTSGAPGKALHLLKQQKKISISLCSNIWTDFSVRKGDHYTRFYLGISLSGSLRFRKLPPLPPRGIELFHQK